MGRKKKIQKEIKEVGESENKVRFNLASEIKRSIAAVILLALAIIVALGFFGSGGTLGKFFNKTLASLVGWSKFVFPFFLAISSIVLLFRRRMIFYVAKLSGLVAMLIGLSAFFHWFFEPDKMAAAAKSGSGGGYAGFFLVYILEKYLGNAGSLVIILALFLIGAIMAFNFSFSNLADKFKKDLMEEEVDGEIKKEDELAEFKKEEETLAEIKTEAKSESEPDQIREEMLSEKNIGRIEFAEGRDQFISPALENENFSSAEIFKKKIMPLREIDSGIENADSDSSKNYKKKKWIFPPLDSLEKSFGTAKGGDINKNFEIIIKTLKDFGIVVEKGESRIGPAVTQYSFRPAVGVKIAKIMALQNDLSLALAKHPIRIEAPIPGQSLIGIEVPNETSLTVRLRDMLEQPKFTRRTTNLLLALGEDVSGTCVFDDLAKMPHLMIAGATGTGKSVCINSIITTLLYQNSPENLKFIMVDPKRVELSLYNGIPHLLADVVVENGKVINVLKWAVGEMERRYRLLQETSSRDILSYREKIKIGKTIQHKDPETGEVNEEKLKNLPYIVIVIDELADLMGSHGKEVEGAIVRIAQMARAVGIHLIISTQRPSVEVITGLIKANITTRIAFQVATQIDSRTILDMGGAEKLLGNGDMLFLSSSSPKPKRIQGVFVSETEVKRVVSFIKKYNKKEEKEENEEKITENSQKEILEYKSDDSEDNDDGLLETAKEEIIRFKKASASLLQRRLRIGYNRAARILDILEEKGVIGPADGSKPREVYITEEKKETNYEDSIEDQEKRDKWDL